MISILYLITSIWIGLILENRCHLMRQTLWARIAFSVIVGQLVSTWLVFILSIITGFGNKSILLGTLIMSLYMLFEWKRNCRNLSWVKNQIINADKSLSMVQILLFCAVMPYFAASLWEAQSGEMFFRGNYNDLSYHSSIMSSFLEQNTLFPDNPQSAGHQLNYHFMVDFNSAILKQGGFSFYHSIYFPQIIYSFSLCTVLYYFFKMILKSEKKVFFASALFTMGHTAFFNLAFTALGYPLEPLGPALSSWSKIREVLLYPFFNFLDPVINLFQPQPPFLFSFPLALIVLSGLYRAYIQKKNDFSLIFFSGVIIGLTPFYHIHTFLILSAVYVALLFYYCRDPKLFFAAVSPLILAIPQLCFLASQPHASYFSGFDVHTLGGGLTEITVFHSAFMSRIVFWLRAAGFPLIFGFTGFFVHLRWNSFISKKNEILSILLLVTFSFFILINFYRFSPSWGDSNKFFLYLDLILAIYAGEILGMGYNKGILQKIVVAALIGISAILPFGLESYVIFSRPADTLYSACDRKAADWIKQNTASDAIFLTSNDVIHYVPSLGGRKVVDGAYTWETGYLRPETQNDVATIYKTGDANLLNKYNVSYVVIGPQERNRYSCNDIGFQRYPIVYYIDCKGKNYKIYDIKRKDLNNQIQVIGNRESP